MNLLFVTSNRLGDAVLSTGILGHLTESHPGARVTIACGPVAAPLFAEVPGLARVIVMTKRRRSLHWLALWRQTATTLWDLVIDLRGSALAWLLPTRRRIVFRPTHAAIHRVRQLGSALGLREPPPPRLWLAEHHRRAAAALLASEAPVLAVGPTANWGGKQWPAERFAETVRRLTSPGGALPEARVAVVGAAAERPAAQPVIDAVPPERRIDLVGRTDLLTLAACLERSRLYIGNDSGLMHMAAAAGAPTLGLFGPSREELYHPWGEHAAWVRTDASYRDIVEAPEFDYRSQRSLMTTLPVERVVAAAAELLDRARAAA